MLFPTGIGHPWWMSGTQVPLPTIESVAGIFDNATTTYPLSALAAILFRSIGADCIARSGVPYPSFTVGGASRFISFSLSHPRCAPETARLLAVAGLEQPSFDRHLLKISPPLMRSVHLRIPGRSLHSSLPHHRLSGLDQKLKFSRRRSFCLCHAQIQLRLGIGRYCCCRQHARVRLPLLLAYFINVPTCWTISRSSAFS